MQINDFLSYQPIQNNKNSQINVMDAHFACTWATV